LDHVLPQEQRQVTFSEQERCQPEGAANYSTLKFETEAQADSLEENSEALYDQPLVVLSGKPNDDEIQLMDIPDPKSLFDDPGYTRGMLAEALSRQEENRGYENVELTDEESSSSQHETETPSDGSAREVAHRQYMASMNSLLVYEESELENLDPDIAACLVDDSGMKISYV